MGERRRRTGLVGALTLALGLSLAAGCADSGEESGEESASAEATTAAPGTVKATAPEGGGSAEEGATSAAAPVDPADIPPGREIAEGGGGPTQYTFREEWRRALGEAQAWREGAYLYEALGRYVNDEGVPSEWRMSFISGPAATADAVLVVTIDPWGNVTATEEMTESLGSHVSEFDQPVPVDVIDSDEAVTLGRAALGATFNLEDAQDPYVTVGFSELDGTGPFWRYGFFYPPTAEYASVPLDGVTGDVVPQPAQPTDG
jgi:hypothetical protein